MARHPGQDCIYLVTTTGIYRSPRGTPYLSPGTRNPNPAFRFDPITSDGTIVFGEAGLALLYDPSTRNFVCFSLGTDKSFKLKACRIDLDATGSAAKVGDPFEVELRRPEGQMGDDGLGSGASFRWGGTAQVASDGHLEIYAAPKRLDNLIGNVSNVLRWRFGWSATP